MTGEGSTPSVTSDDVGIEIDVDGEVDSDGSQTPIISVDVQGGHPQGATPVAPGPGPGPGQGGGGGGGGWTGGSSGMLFTNLPPNHQAYWQQNQHAGPSQFSQSAPAATSGPIPWPAASSVNGVGLDGRPQHQSSMPGGWINGPAHQPAPASAGGGGGGAQHVTGMMGATGLEDLDEADEAYGEESEILDGE
jgi:F-box and leucine-rich repeat protein GRR1